MHLPLLHHGFYFGKPGGSPRFTTIARISRITPTLGTCGGDGRAGPGPSDPEKQVLRGQTIEIMKPAGVTLRLWSGRSAARTEGTSGAPHSSRFSGLALRRRRA